MMREHEEGRVEEDSQERGQSLEILTSVAFMSVVTDST